MILQMRQFMIPSRSEPAMNRNEVNDMSEYNPRTVTGPLMLTLCLEENSILVSRAVLEAMEQPRQIQMLINEDRKMLLLKACTVDEREAVVIPPEIFTQFEMSGHALLRRIRKLTGWTDSLPRVVYGNYIASHRAIVFDLHTAQPAELRMPPDGSPGRSC